jgi:hypothetical protein
MAAAVLEVTLKRGGLGLLFRSNLRPLIIASFFNDARLTCSRINANSQLNKHGDGTGAEGIITGQ